MPVMYFFHSHRFTRTSTASLASALFALVLLACAPNVDAANWYRLSQADARNTDRAALIRQDGVLHAIFRHKGAASTQGLFHRTVSAAGVPSVTTDTVFADWGSFTNPDIVSEGPSFRLLFSGLRSVDVTDPYTSGSLYSAVGNGASWTLQAPHGSSNKAYASTEVSGDRSLDGTLLSTWTGTGLLLLDAGLGASQQDLENSCCPYSSNLGADAKNNAVWLSWFSNVTGRYGQYVRQAYPTLGESIYLPGSANANRSSALSPDDRLPITGRIGATGVYIAYCSGYPTCTVLRLIRAGNSTSIPLTTSAKIGSSFRNVDIAAAPSGRLWVMWSSYSKLFVARTNKAATRIGAVQVLAGPSGMDTIYDVSGQGSAGPLDLVGNFDTSAGVALWTRHIFPKLSMAIAPAKVDNDMAHVVKFTVTDAGDPLQGAKVKVMGTTYTTNSAGRVSVTVPKGTSTGRKPVKATKSGYTPATGVVRVVN